MCLKTGANYEGANELMATVKTFKTSFNLTIFLLSKTWRDSRSNSLKKITPSRRNTLGFAKYHQMRTFLDTVLEVDINYLK